RLAGGREVHLGEARRQRGRLHELERDQVLHGLVSQGRAREDGQLRHRGRLRPQEHLAVRVVHHHEPNRAQGLEDQRAAGNSRAVIALKLALTSLALALGAGGSGVVSGTVTFEAKGLSGSAPARSGEAIVYVEKVEGAKAAPTDDAKMTQRNKAFEPRL